MNPQDAGTYCEHVARGLLDRGIHPLWADTVEVLYDILANELLVRFRAGPPLRFREVRLQRVDIEENRGNNLGDAVERALRPYPTLRACREFRRLARRWFLR